MRIDLTDTEVEDGKRIYIQREGKITLKVVKVTEGFTTNKNPFVKVHFQDNTGAYTTDEFVVTENALWKIKLFTKALKLPNVIDTNMFYDRYVIAEMKKKQTTNGHIYEIKSYEPSKLTNTYEYTAPTPQHQQYKTHEQQGEYPQHTNQQHLPIDDINEDEIPF